MVTLPGHRHCRRAALALALSLLAGTATAACNGVDLIARMSAEARTAMEAEAAEVPNGEGRLWRVEAPGGAVGHLFGTYHDTEAAGTLTPAVRAAFDTATTLVVELTEDEFAAMEARIAADPSFSFGGGRNGLGAQLAASLDREERAAAEEALAARGLSLAAAAQLKPWLLFSLLGTPACQLAAMGAGAPVLDRVLIEDAAARGVPVRGLETYEAALAAFDEIGEEASLGLARDMLALAPHDEDIRRTMLTLYVAGRTGMISVFSTEAAEIVGVAQTGTSAEAEALADAFSEAILEGRNRAWMTPLREVLSRPGGFVAVGALHLPGEEGLVALLQAEGFTVEPVAE
ncbi:MAG: TraB/GumN family protein [Pseudomonadota bacterium]